MPKRKYRTITELTTGTRFLFAYDGTDPTRLHIEVRHDVTAEEAMRVFFNQRAFYWNEVNKRFEADSDTHTLYWAHHASGAILVITCFRKEE